MAIPSRTRPVTVPQAKASVAVLLSGRLLAVSSEDRLRPASKRIAVPDTFAARLRAVRIASGLSPGLLAEKCRLVTLNDRVPSVDRP